MFRFFFVKTLGAQGQADCGLRNGTNAEKRYPGLRYNRKKPLLRTTVKQR